MSQLPEPVTLIQAINQALAFAMQDDNEVIILGQDVGNNGGVFRATEGLKKQFGDHRVLDTPLAESLIAGVSVGMATQGLKPVAEIQFMGFILATLEHIITHAARMRNRTRGRLTCPLVIRAPFGGGIHAPEHHSESLETLFAHIPGLRVVIPSSPQLAYGLLLSAIKNPDPVIFLEPKRIYRAFKQPILAPGKSLPLDTCYTLRQGVDVTLISWGACIVETLQASQLLANLGIQAEVIDVATIKPLDIETISLSLAKTGRAVIIHEACRSHGVGAEIVAQLLEENFSDLKAPIKRVTGPDVIMPYFKNEQYYLPQISDIVNAVKKIMQ